MKHLPGFLVLLTLAIAAAVGIAFGAEGSDAQRSSSLAFTCSLPRGLDKLPPQSATFIAHPFRTPVVSPQVQDTARAGPTVPTVDIGKPVGTPALGFDTWEEFTLWADTQLREAQQGGHRVVLLGDDATPSATPPFGCLSWQELERWLQQIVQYPTPLE